MKSFPFHFQADQSDCGPTCLKMVAEFYGKRFHRHQMENWSGILNDGWSMLDIIDTASSLGITSTGLEINIEHLRLIDLPTILHWDRYHFVVLFEIQDNFYFIADPAIGILKLGKQDFLRHWQIEKDGHYDYGILLTLSVISTNYE